jgi:6-pyruvoyltetrahydropterin/6-carboxytetrahydropterin synthase
MIRLTRIFSFEMAHALDNYAGDCRNIHGHSYELHVTVTSDQPESTYFPSPGILMDFKDLKQLVNGLLINNWDHKITLSRTYVEKNPATAGLENLILMEAEPSAENLLIHAQKTLTEALPKGIRLCAMRLYETRNSYAEWIAD